MNRSGSSETQQPKYEKHEYYGFDLYPDRRREKDPTFIQKSVGEYSRTARDRIKCESRVLEAVKTNPMVRLLVNALESAGCPFDIARNISCEHCDSKVTGGYDVEWNQIVICENGMKASYYPGITLTHELIHMYDYCVNEIDFKNNDHLACTEIRAANMSHCSFISSLLLGQSSLFDIKKTHQFCVKTKAAQSLMVARNMDFETATKYVLKVFDKCYNDLEPIGRRARRASNEPYMAYRDSIHYGYSQPINEEGVN